MTTATATTPVETFHSAEVARLTAAVEAGRAQLKATANEVVAATGLLTAVEAELAVLGQEASTWQQQLAAATTRPERHRFELLLEDNVVRQGPVADRRRVAADRVALGTSAVTRETAALGRATADLAAATADLAGAHAAAAATATLMKDLDAAVGGVLAAVAGLGDRRAAAVARLTEVLGGPALFEHVQEQVVTADAEIAERAATLAAARAQVQAAAVARSAIDAAVASAAAALDAALVAVRTAVRDAPVRAADLEKVLTEAATLPAIADQAAITEAADEAVAGGAGATARWWAALPGRVRELAVAVARSGAELAELGALDAAVLAEGIARAQDAHAAALAAAQALRLREDDAAAAVAAAVDDVQAHEATAADRLTGLLRGGE